LSKYIDSIKPFLEKTLFILALGFLLNLVVPDTCFDTKGFEMEEYDEREREADEEKKQHSTKDQLNCLFSLINKPLNLYLLEFYHINRIKSNYKDHYYGVITPPPEMILSFS